MSITLYCKRVLLYVKQDFWISMFYLILNNISLQIEKQKRLERIRHKTQQLQELILQVDCTFDHFNHTVVGSTSECLYWDSTFRFVTANSFQESGAEKQGTGENAGAPTTEFSHTAAIYHSQHEQKDGYRLLHIKRQVSLLQVSVHKVQYLSENIIHIKTPSSLKTMNDQC